VILGRAAKLRRAGVLGINRRNSAFTLKYNQRRFYPLVDDKVLCKRRLQEHGLAVPELIGVVRFNSQVSRLEGLLGDHQEFVIKPAHGSGGNGILVITDRRQDYFVSSDGKPVQKADLAHYLTNVTGGLYSLGGQPDDPDCYTAEGKVDYETCRQKPFFQAGIDRLSQAWQQGHAVVLMCSEGKPENCHRTKLIGRTLTAEGIEVVHIDEADEPISQADVMLRLTGGQPSLFGDDFFNLTSRKRYRDTPRDAGEPEGG